MAEKNDIVIEAWNTVLFDKFCRFKHLLIDGLAAHSDEALARTAYPEGARVLDIGCGFGDSTQHIARKSGREGAPWASTARPIRRDRARETHGRPASATSRSSSPTCRSDDLRGPLRLRLLPLRNHVLHDAGRGVAQHPRALAPGGKLAMIVWRRREENPWLHDAELCVRALVPVVSHEDTDQVHCGPGPFSMSGPDLVSTMLRSAGYDRIAFERFDADICIGRDLDEAVEFAMALGPAGEIIRLAGDEGQKRKPQVVEALRETLSRYARADGVWAPSSTWFVTARNP